MSVFLRVVHPEFGAWVAADQAVNVRKYMDVEGALLLVFENTDDAIVMKSYFDKLDNHSHLWGVAARYPQALVRAWVVIRVSYC